MAGARVNMARTLSVAFWIISAMVFEMSSSMFLPSLREGVLTRALADLTVELLEFGAQIGGVRAFGDNLFDLSRAPDRNASQRASRPLS